MLEMLAYGFMVRAIIVGLLVAVSAALIGQFLVLRGYSMIGDGLAHVSFGIVALALSMGLLPEFLSIPMVTIASVVLLRSRNLQSDAAIGLISSFFVAFGVMIASLSKGFNADILSYLFGSLLALRESDVWLSLLLFIFMLTTTTLFYKRLLSVTFDEEYARVSGINTGVLDIVLGVMTAVTIVVGIRIVGSMLISALIVFPTVISQSLKRGFLFTLIFGTFLSVIGVLTGITLSFIYNLPTGASIVVVNGVMFLLVSLLTKFNQLKLQK